MRSFLGGITKILCYIVVSTINDSGVDNIRDRAAFLRLEGGGGGLNEMPKAYLAPAAGASVLGGYGGMLPRKICKINASRMAKDTSQYSRHSEFFYYSSG